MHELARRLTEPISFELNGILGPCALQVLADEVARALAQMRRGYLRERSARAHCQKGHGFGRRADRARSGEVLNRGIALDGHLGLKGDRGTNTLVEHGHLFEMRPQKTRELLLVHLSV